VVSMISSDVFYKVLQYCGMVTLAIMLVWVFVNPVTLIFFAIPILITAYFYVFRPSQANKKVKDDLLALPPKEAKR
jgi:type IV secretory pathway VirB3-like protein